ncbi:MAG: CvpA family protein [Clostridia bacterium]
MNFIIAIVLDALTIFILVYSLFRGKKKGFVKTGYSLISWLLSLLVAWKLFPYVGKGLRALGLFGKLQGYIGSHLSGRCPVQRRLPCDPKSSVPKIFAGVLIENTI